MKNWVSHLYTTIWSSRLDPNVSLLVSVWSPPSQPHKVALQSYDICTIVRLQSHNACTTDLTYKNRLYVYNLALITLADQSVVIGIEKKEDKWHEKWGLASLYDNLVPSSSFRRPCYTLLLCELETNDTLDQERRKNL